MAFVNKIVLTVVITIVCCPFLHAQTKEKDNRVPVAILDLISAKNADFDDDGINTTLQGIVTKIFTENSKFKILDRSSMQAILKEIHTEQGEEFLNSKNLVTQGQLTGAKYIISGVVTRYQNVSNKVSIAFTFSIIDLETGVTLYSNLIQSNNNIISETTGVGDETKAATDKIEEQIKDIVLHIFHPDFHIIQLAEVDSKGRLQKVLLDQGDDFFKDIKKGGMLGLSKKTSLTVTEIEVIKGTDGKDIKVFNNIGDLSFDEMKGPGASSWKVKAKDDGKKIIDHFNGDKKMIVEYAKD